MVGGNLIAILTPSLMQIVVVKSVLRLYLMRARLSVVLFLSQTYHKVYHFESCSFVPDFLSSALLSGL